MTDQYIDVLLFPCPWCKKTPKLLMPISNHNSKGTWSWHIHCYNDKCAVRPRSPHVNIREGKKENIHWIRHKLEELATMWNINNPIAPYEKLRISVETLKKEYAKQIEYDASCIRRSALP